MDFFTIGIREGKKGEPPEIFPDFRVGRSKDLMVRGRSFYAIWDEKVGLWSTDEYAVQRLVDEELFEFAKMQSERDGITYKVKTMESFGSNNWAMFRKFLNNISDNSHPLDENLTFANTEVKKSDYVSRRLPYALEPGDHSAWDELTDTLYSPEEKAKFEWAIGAIVAGEAKKIQKFLVFYGPGGTGKSTIMNVIADLFVGYTTTFEAKALTSNNAAFATEVFKDNPLVAIQQDGDLSKMEDNSKFNSIISHEDMTMNEKYKPSYTARVLAFLFMGTNLPVKISDSKSGIIRRLIDVHPTGVIIPPVHYHSLVGKIQFELGAIAHHCLEVYRGLGGKSAYNGYKPLEMMFQTDVFFNFIEAHFDIFKSQDGASLKQAYALYKEWCSESTIDRILPAYKFREEFKNYFEEFHERTTVAGEPVRSYFKGFTADKFKVVINKEPDKPPTFALSLEEEVSSFDLIYAEQPAQMGRLDEFGKIIPSQRWSNVKTTLSEIDTHEIHFVKIPDEHVIIDFDLKDDTGEKSLLLNMEAASSWPSTYAELSQGGNGIHLHYNYSGDVTELAALYSEGVEVKTLLGDASLRRRLSKCNNLEVATLNPGQLPVKEKKVLSDHTLKSEKGLRDLIQRNLNKEFHAGTKPSIDFIKHILDEAYESGMAFDVTDMRPRILAFANSASNQPLQALKIVQSMRWTGSETIEDLQERESPLVKPKDDRLVLFDVEVYPNLFVVCWKYEGAPKETIVRMINPTSDQIASLMQMKLVGFNNRKYDNHILYARFLGYDNMALYKRSQAIINGSVGAFFPEAYNLSYADIYDFSSVKQGLKKFMIDLGIHKVEMEIPWDQPVPAELVDKVVDYCCNDVEGTDATLQDRKADLVARQILAELSGLSVNDTTQKHTARIIFGNDKNPQSKFVYTDLSRDFPGYKFDTYAKVGEKSTYKGEFVGEGGLVRAKPGIYRNVALLDVASMHPTSLIELNAFGDTFTPKFKDLLDARLLIKHKKYDEAKQMLDGKLEPYLGDPGDAKRLSYALKIVINIVYGLTSAKFDNPFRDPRNVDNIVAKRGALFMLDLRDFVESRGFIAAHIKTDSIKIPDATPEIIQEVMDFGAKYGYTFEHEATYDRMALVNDAVYIAKYGWAEDEELIGKWTATGAQFQHPYVFKTLFSQEKLDWNDYVEPKQVQQGTMYLDFESVSTPMFLSEGDKKLQFVGKIGTFVPVTPESGGGLLFRIKDEKKYAVTGTKGFFWLEADVAKARGRDVDLDMSYFEGLQYESIKTIEKFGNFEEFIDDTGDYELPENRAA